MAKRVHYEDLVIDLYLLNHLDTGGGRKKVAKLLFLLEEDLFHQNKVGPHYVMQKYQMGPYNGRIETNLENLTKHGYLKHTNLYYPNSNTSKFIKEVDDLLQENSTIFNKLDDILAEFGNDSGDKIAEYIYSLPQIGMKKQSIYKYKDFEVIIDPRKITNPKFTFYLDDAWYDTIEILLNPRMFLKLQSAVKDCQLGNFTF